MTSRQENALHNAKIAKLEYADCMKGIAEKLNMIENNIYNHFSYDDFQEMKSRLWELAQLAEDAHDCIDDYIDAMDEYEDAKHDEKNEPDSIESLGLQGLF